MSLDVLKEQAQKNDIGIIKMKNIFNKKAFIFFLLFIFQIPANADYKADTKFSSNCLKDYKEFVVRAVCDGDTISLTSCKNEEKEKKIRLLGIDAFEHDQVHYGEKGKQFLSKLVLNKKVCIETDVNENDVYGRTLGYVFLNNTFINEELLKNGLALLYDFPPNIKYIDKLKKAQIYARKKMIGVWKDSDYIKETPAEYRKRNR